jgi:hypothetical protein
MDSSDLENRFNYHTPRSTKRREAHTGIRLSCHELAKYLDEMIPEGREKSLAITNLEQVMFWANAALARQQDDS